MSCHQVSPALNVQWYYKQKNFFQTNLVIEAWSERCQDFRFVLVQVACFRMFDIEAGTGKIMGTTKRTVFYWRRRDRLICRVQRTLYRTVLGRLRLPEWHHLNCVFCRRHENNGIHQEQQLLQQDHHRDRCLAHLLFPCLLTSWT